MTSLRVYVSVACSDCGVVFNKRKDSLRAWGGRCGPCAAKEVGQRPEFRELRKQNAREQVMRQGGIPNARKFTAEIVRQVKTGTRYSLTPEQKLRRRQSPNIPRGAKSHLWRGGVTAANAIARQSIEYKLWREAVFARDNHTCQICGTRHGPLNADHIKPWCTHKELRFDVDNGRTLCVPCHRSTETYGWKFLMRLKRLGIASKE